MEKIDNPSVDNVVWNEGNVFYTHPYGESYYDNRTPNLGGGNSEHHIAIHNPTVDAYTGSNEITIRFYDVTTGVQITDSDGVLNTSPSPSWLSWNGTDDQFEVSVPSMMTRLVLDDYLFQASKDGVFTMKIHSPKTGGGEGAFYATTHKSGLQRWRIDAGDTSADFGGSYRAYRGYTLPSSNDLDGLTSPMLILPYWKDSDNELIGSATTTYVHIVNVDSVDVDITVEVFELDSTSRTLIKSHTFEDVAPNSRITFVPSQFLDSGDPADPEEGYLEASAVQSASPSTVGEILGSAHPLRLTLAYWNILYGMKGYQRGIKGEALAIIDNN